MCSCVCVCACVCVCVRVCVCSRSRRKINALEGKAGDLPNEETSEVKVSMALKQRLMRLAKDQERLSRWQSKLRAIDDVVYVVK